MRYCHEQAKRQEERRRAMVAAVRKDRSLRDVAREFGVGVATVACWVRRAQGQRLDRVDWSDRPSVPHKTRRTDPSLEDRVLRVRRALAQGDLGAVGADVIRQALLGQGLPKVPSVRTLNRILGRRGAPDGNKGTRRPAPPKGWDLPEVAAARAGRDHIDLVEGLVIKDGPHVEVLNGASLHGGRTASWPVESPVTSRWTVSSLLEHCQEVGWPGYAPFDKNMISQGTPRYPDAWGRVLPLCLSLGIVPVSVPPTRWASRP